MTRFVRPLVATAVAVLAVSAATDARGQTPGFRPQPRITLTAPVVASQPRALPRGVYAVPVVTPAPAFTVPQPMVRPFVPVPVTTVAWVQDAYDPWAQYPVPVVLPATPVWNEGMIRDPIQLRPVGGWTYQPAYNVERGRYLPYAGSLALNSTTGSIYNGSTDTFFRTDGLYRYNPFTNRYANPVTGAQFNPWTRVTVR